MTEYDAILYIFWDESTNCFYDPCGFRLYIYEVVTPNDIILFRQDPGYCCFPHKDDPRILCEIVTEE